MSLIKKNMTLSNAPNPVTATCRVLAAVIVAAMVTPAIALTASAADYRYWTFWTAGPLVECRTPEGGVALVCEEITTRDKWAFAQVGAQDVKPVDRTVTGWRFAISTPDGSDAPSSPASFAELCPDMSEPVSDQHRVAVVIDFGSTNIAPNGETPPTPNKVECVSLEVGQSAADALVLATSEVRADGGFVCGIDGYPSEECGVEVDSASLPAQETPAAANSESGAEVAETEVVAVEEPLDDQSPAWLWPIVGLVVVGALVLIFFAARRGKSTA